MIYLAIPYSHPDPAVREQRYQLANRVTAQLIQQGHVVFSPISHSHNISPLLPPQVDTWETWKMQDLPFLRVCSTLVVITAEGWRESVGVQAEIQEAYECGLEIEYLTP